jgi:hypothetical protein
VEGGIIVSCYTRHLDELFKEMGIEDTKANRKTMDGHIREALGIIGEGCPTVWKEVKARLDDDEGRKDLVSQLRELIESA